MATLAVGVVVPEAGGGVSLSRAVGGGMCMPWAAEVGALRWQWWWWWRVWAVSKDASPKAAAVADSIWLRASTKGSWGPVKFTSVVFC